MMDDIMSADSDRTDMAISSVGQVDVLKDKWHTLIKKEFFEMSCLAEERIAPDHLRIVETNIICVFPEEVSDSTEESCFSST